MPIERESKTCVGPTFGLKPAASAEYMMNAITRKLPCVAGGGNERGPTPCTHGSNRI